MVRTPHQVGLVTEDSTLEPVLPFGLVTVFQVLPFQFKVGVAAVDEPVGV